MAGKGQLFFVSVELEIKHKKKIMPHLQVRIEKLKNHTLSRGTYLA